ncbi:ATP-binding protein [Paenibacillus koleovorans]|uniref:ATP-binding protein n=1 Tax=Paenibacillus koleovorans TaxID=121608 RepID=UPI000FD9ED65|nr:sensor histidine kinase [Paenibacillus koleovorans]
MIISFLIVSILASVILIKNKDRASMLWGSAFLFAVCLSVVCSYIDIQLSQAPALLINSLNFMADCSLAYTFGMFGIVHSDLFDIATRKKLGMLGAAAIFLVWLFTPLSTIRQINYEDYNALPMVIYVAVMWIAGSVSLLIACFREKHPFKKRERLFTNVLMIPVMLWIVISYIGYMAGIDLWRYSYVVSLCFLIIFLVMGISRGVLGVKLKIEQYKADVSWHTMKNSTTLLNHTVKNEVAKLDLLLHQLKTVCSDQSRTGPIDQAGLDDMQHLIDTASASVGHVQSMIDKIHDKVQAVRVELQRSDFQSIVELALSGVENTIGKGVTFRRDFRKVSPVYCDPVHVKEVVHNLVTNAVDAVEQNGIITVSLHETSKDVILEIHDTGQGIPKQSLSAIFDPFYSTKKTNRHYGLGLFYCKNVIAKHNGTLYVESAQDRGTSFFVHLRK